MHDLVILALLALATLLLITIIMWLLARHGGWRELADHYPRMPGSLGPSRGGLTSIRLRGLAGYNNCILWRADDEYLHLRILPPLAFFHPPLSIPWTEIQLAAPPRRWFVRLRAGGIPLTLPARVIHDKLDLLAPRETATA